MPERDTGSPERDTGSPERDTGSKASTYIIEAAGLTSSFLLLEMSFPRVKMLISDFVDPKCQNHFDMERTDLLISSKKRSSNFNNSFFTINYNDFSLLQRILFPHDISANHIGFVDEYNKVIDRLLDMSTSLICNRPRL